MCLIWGTTWMAIKVGLEDLTPFFSLGLRYIMAGTCLAIYLLIIDRKVTVDRKQWKLTFLITLFNFIIPYSLVYWGEQFIYSDLAAVIFAMLPINVMILSLVFLKEEKITFTNLLGILIGFSGIITIFSKNILTGIGFHFYGMIAIFLASVSQAVMVIILKKNQDNFHPLKINLFPMLITGILITGFSFLVENISKNTFTTPAIFSIFYLSIFGSVIAFTIFFWLIKHIKVILLSAMSYILPVIAIIVGWIFLNEQLSKLQILGFLLIVFSIILITHKKRKQPIKNLP